MHQIDREEIRKWVTAHMQDLTETLKIICRIPSVAQTEHPDAAPYGEGCKRVLRKMLRMGEEEGFTTRNYEDYVGSISYPGRGSESIGIWCHLDVVEEGKDWDYPPFEPTVKDGYMIARGCQDNKSSAAMGFYVLKYMKEHGITLDHTLELYLGTCEEKGMYDLDYYVAHYDCPTLSLVPDSGFPVCCGERGTFNGELVGEAFVTGDVVDLTCDCGQYTIPDKARAVLRYTRERWEKCQAPGEKVEVSREGDTICIQAGGISSQAANPAKGDSALGRLAGFVCGRKLLEERDLAVFTLAEDICQDYQGTALGVACQDAVSGPMVLSATRLSLCEDPDGSRRPVLGFISKFPVSESEKELPDMEQIPCEADTEKEPSLVERARKAAAKRGFLLEVTKFAKANCFDPAHPAVQVLTDCSNRVLGRQDAPFVMSGGTYARKLPRAFAFGTGMPLPPRPAALFRPGHGDYHQPDESIALERIQKALEIYIQGILEIDGLVLGK